MDRACQNIQELLVENAGDAARLGAADRRHVDGCDECSRVLDRERRLAELLQSASPPEDAALQASIMAAVGPAARGRRLLAWLPVAVSLLVAVTGAALVGGVPGGGVVRLLPTWSVHGWAALAGSAGDWVTAMVALARSARVVMPLGVQLAAVAVALLAASGAWTLAAAWQSRRLRHGTVAWRRGD